MNNSENNIRKMKGGEWYWVSKSIIQKYARLLGFSAITVYHFLASMVNREQRCFPSQKYIAEHLGCSRSTVNRAIKTLLQQKLIVSQKRYGNRMEYRLLGVRCSTNETKLLHRRNSNVLEGDINNTKVKIDKNNNVVGVKNNLSGEDDVTAKEKLLASDIARGLGDSGNILTYLFYAHNYSELFLRRVLSEVKLTPAHKIKKSRAALFHYLIRFYADKHS